MKQEQIPSAQPGHSMDTLTLYKALCDLWAEANAVDTVIGRPDALMAKLTALRDAVGSMTGAYLAAPAATQPEGQEAVDAAMEAVRKAFCKLPRYSFHLDGSGGVRRVHEFSGNWVEVHRVHELFDPVMVDAARAAQAGGGNHA